MSDIKPILQYIIICDDIAVYQDSNKIAILGVFEQIFVEQLPTNHPKFWLLSRFTNGQGSFKTQNKIKNPLNQYIFQSEIVSFALEDKSHSYNINGQLLGLPLETEGTYSVETYLDDNLINTTPLQVLTTAHEVNHGETTYH